MIRKLIIFLCVILYLSALLIVIATLNIQPTSEGGAADKLTETSSLPADSSELEPVDVPASSAKSSDQVEEENFSEVVQSVSSELEPVDVPASSAKSAAQIEEVYLAELDPPVGIKEPVHLATLGGGIFKPGQDIINLDLSHTVLQHVPDIINSIPEYKILIEGHTDSLPIKNPANRKFSSNKELSLMRAKATASMLQAAAVPGESIIIKGYGDEQPVASNASREGRARNRRIEMWLVPVNQASGNGE